MPPHRVRDAHAKPSQFRAERNAAPRNRKDAMSVKTVETVISKFLSKESNETLSLTGAWGVGKTFVWNKLLREAGVLAKPQSYSYVSLFGIASMVQLRTAIMLKSKPLSRLDQPSDFLRLDSDWGGRMTPVIKGIGEKVAGFFGGSSAGKGINYALETLAPFAVKDMLVCLDDFERLKEVTVEEILGLISELKEERGCKIVLIFNAGELAKNKTMAAAYASYREKVIDLEVEFAPTPLEAFELAFEPTFPNREQVATRVQALEVTNIRILRKTRRALLDVLGSVGPAHPRVRDQAISTTVLLCWCAFQPETGKPRTEEIADWNHMLWSRRVGSDPAPPEEAAWAKRFKAYGFNGVNELDIAIGAYVQRGFIEESGVPEAAKTLSSVAEAQDLDNAFSEAWDLFHNSFANNADLVVAKLVQTLKQSALTLNVMNLDGTVRLLRTLGQDASADDLIDFFISAHTKTPDTFDTSSHRLLRRIEDSAIKNKFAAAHAKLTSLPTLSESARFYADNSGWNPEHIEAMKKATVDEFHDFFMMDHGDDLNRLIKACLNIGSAEDSDIALKAKGALKRIAATSALNAERVGRYGV